jgi:hypothetical protein
MESMGILRGDEWETSFTQILSRTKQKLNRINQRFFGTISMLLYNQSHLHYY